MERKSVSKEECSVCFRIPRAKIFQCANEHSICEAGSTRVKACPTCQSLRVKLRNRLAEKLLDDIKFECNWNQLGCEKTMSRSELSTHEDLCDHNPEIVKFCSKFPEGRKCPNKFTPKWLSEPQNCTIFTNHVLTCLGPPVLYNEGQYGVPFCVKMIFKDLVSKKFNPNRLAHHSFSPFFYRFPYPNQKDKVQLLAIFFLLTDDKLGNRSVSFAFVQLTSGTTQMVGKIAVIADSSSKMISNHGKNSLPLQCWTQKPMGFTEFLKMVEKSPNNPERKIAFPYSLPVAFLSKYYSNAENEFVVRFMVGLTS